MVPTLTHTSRGRSARTVIALLAAVGVLAFLHSVGTVTWVLVVLGLFAVPAAFDVLRNPVATFDLDDGYIEWKSNTQHARVPLSQVESVRFDTRWDFSVRATLTLVDKSKMRIPQDTMPPHLALEQALKDRNIKTERHHFRVI
ncbi:hypothetical protein CSC82_15630 [Rhodobacteraceae bacterium 4F10]|nr:hypothetical protein CSC82_15630 [Rhodobacteraceae bacterium 4F10]